MAILSGSSMRALRVGSGRGPTLRTAPRGAESGWVKHATGFTCPSRSDHRDQRTPEPLVASALSPDIPLELASRSPLKPGVAARILKQWHKDRHQRLRRKCLSFFGLHGSELIGCGKLTYSYHAAYPCSSTECGYVNPQIFILLLSGD